MAMLMAFWTQFQPASHGREESITDFDFILEKHAQGGDIDRGMNQMSICNKEGPMPDMFTDNHRELQVPHRQTKAGIY